MRDWPQWQLAHSADDPPRRATDADKNAFRLRIQRQRKLARDDVTYVWGIFGIGTGELIGILDIHILVREDLQKANLGYEIYPPYRRQGYGRAAAAAGIELAFSTLKLNRLEAVIDPDNLGSIALVKSLGFNAEGLRINYLYEDGRWLDQVVYTVNRQQRGYASLIL